MPKSTHPKNKKERYEEIFVTRPHGAQTVTRVMEDGDDYMSNPDNIIFLIENVNGAKIGLTGWELSDLANQWLAYEKSCR